MQPNHACTSPSSNADSGSGAPASVPAGEAALREAQRLFGRTLQAWAMDVLRLRAMGLDRPRAWNDLALTGGPAAPPRKPVTYTVARDVRKAA